LAISTHHDDASADAAAGASASSVYWLSATTLEEKYMSCPKRTTLVIFPHKSSIMRTSFLRVIFWPIDHSVYILWLLLLPTRTARLRLQIKKKTDFCSN
jgi:hypothetical protein